MNRTITGVPGILVGHAEVEQSGPNVASGVGGSGCTVVLGPFRGAAFVAGPATGTRELQTLDPEHMVPRVDALLLTGGSAFGLAAADGVMAWLEERGRGYSTRAGVVPIVPAAVIYDLEEGRGRPTAATGRRACENASAAAVPMGRVGAGSGATVGKLAGPERSAPGGVGTALTEIGPFAVGALAVVNSVGDVLDGSGRVVAGGRRDDEPPVVAGDPGPRRGSRTFPMGHFGGPWPADAERGRHPLPGANTTLAVVATDAPLSRVELRRLARMASTALPRRIEPVHTPVDGDIVFALSTAGRAAASGSGWSKGSKNGIDSDPGRHAVRPEGVEPGSLLQLGLRARDALEEAITASVAPGEGA